MDTTTQSNGMSWLDSLTNSVGNLGSVLNNYQMQQVAINNARIVPPIVPPANYITTAAGGISSGTVMMLVLAGVAVFLVMRLKK